MNFQTQTETQASQSEQQDEAARTQVEGKVHQLWLRRGRSSEAYEQQEEDECNESHRYFELEQGENRLRLIMVNNKATRHSILDDTQDFASSQESLDADDEGQQAKYYPSVLSLNSIGYHIEAMQDCRFYFDVDDDILCIKDMQLPPSQASTGNSNSSSVAGDNDDDDDEIEHRPATLDAKTAGPTTAAPSSSVLLLPAGIWRKQHARWEVLPLRQIRILQPGDRFVTAFDKYTQLPARGGLVLEYKYCEPPLRPKNSGGGLLVDSERNSLGLLTQPLEEDDDDEETDTEPSRALLNSISRSAAADATTQPSPPPPLAQPSKQNDGNVMEIHTQPDEPDTDEDSDKTQEMTQLPSVLPPGQPSQYISTQPILEEEDKEEDSVQEDEEGALPASQDSEATEVPAEVTTGAIDEPVKEEEEDSDARHSSNVSIEKVVMNGGEPAESLEATEVPTVEYQVSNPMGNTEASLCDGTAPSQDLEATEVPNVECRVNIQMGDVKVPVDYDGTQNLPGATTSEAVTMSGEDSTERLALLPEETAPSQDLEATEVPTIGKGSTTTTGDVEVTANGDNESTPEAVSPSGENPSNLAATLGAVPERNEDEATPDAKASLQAMDEETKEATPSLPVESFEGEPAVSEAVEKQTIPSQEISISMLRETGEGTPATQARNLATDDHSEITDIDVPDAKDDPPSMAIDSTNRAMKDDDSELTDIPVESKEPSQAAEEAEETNFPSIPKEDPEAQVPSGLSGKVETASIGTEEDLQVSDDDHGNNRPKPQRCIVPDNTEESKENVCNNEETVEVDGDEDKITAKTKKQKRAEAGTNTELLPVEKAAVAREDWLSGDDLSNQPSPGANGNEKDAGVAVKRSSKESGSNEIEAEVNPKRSTRKPKRKSVDEAPLVPPSAAKKSRRNPVDESPSFPPSVFKNSSGRQSKATATQERMTTPTSQSRSTRKRSRETPQSGDLDFDPLPSEPRIMFTGVKCDGSAKKMVHCIGGRLVENLEDAVNATHVIAASDDAELKRTPKLMVALCRTGNIVHYEWLVKSGEAGKALPTDVYQLITKNSHVVGQSVKAAEKTYECNMKETISRGNRLRAKGKLLFHGLDFYLCDGVAGNKSKKNLTPDASTFRLILEGAGAKVVTELHTPQRSIIVTSKLEGEKKKQLKKFAKAMEDGAIAKTTDEVFHAIMTQKFEETPNS